MTRFRSAARPALAPALTLSLGACASLAVTDDPIVERTAFALGVEKDTFKISGRSDEGTTTRHYGKTNAGVDYDGFIAGSFRVIGCSVSDAICTCKGEVAKNPLLR